MIPKADQFARRSIDRGDHENCLAGVQQFKVHMLFQSLKHRMRIVKVRPAEEIPDIAARLIEPVHAEQRKIALCNGPPVLRGIQRECGPKGFQAPARIGSIFGADNACRVDRADRDAGDRHQPHCPAIGFDFVHQFEQRVHRTVFVGSKRAAALEYDPDFDLTLCFHRYCNLVQSFPCTSPRKP
jgi:hypothetical protein